MRPDILLKKLIEVQVAQLAQVWGKLAEDVNEPLQNGNALSSKCLLCHNDGSHNT
jgi:hypothetical protein